MRNAMDPLRNFELFFEIVVVREVNFKLTFLSHEILVHMAMVLLPKNRPADLNPMENDRTVG